MVFSFVLRRSERLEDVLILPLYAQHSRWTSSRHQVNIIFKLSGMVFISDYGRVRASDMNAKMNAKMMFIIHYLQALLFFALTVSSYSPDLSTSFIMRKAVSPRSPYSIAPKFCKHVWDDLSLSLPTAPKESVSLWFVTNSSHTKYPSMLTRWPPTLAIKDYAGFVRVFEFLGSTSSRGTKA